MTAILLPHIRMLLPFLFQLSIFISGHTSMDQEANGTENKSTQSADVIIADHQLRHTCQLKPHLQSVDPTNERLCE